MKSVVLGCDPMGLAPIWEDGGPVGHSLPVEVSDQFRMDLFDWNERMTTIVARPELFSPAELLQLQVALNQEGRALARRLTAESGGKIEARYLAE